jgi:hypothetical protein
LPVDGAAGDDELLDDNARTMKAGRPFVQQVPTPRLRAAMQKGMSKLGVEIDTRSNSIAIEKNCSYRQIKTGNQVTESDRLVLSEIKASAEARGVAKPQMITGEGPTKPAYAS